MRSLSTPLCRGPSSRFEVLMVPSLVTLWGKLDTALKARCPPPSGTSTRRAHYFARHRVARISFAAHAGCGGRGNTWNAWLQVNPTLMEPADITGQIEAEIAAASGFSSYEELLLTQLRPGVGSFDR